MNPVLTHQKSLAHIFCFLRQLSFTFQGSLFAFISARAAAESNLLSITLLTNCTDVPPFCPHFVCKLILEGWGELTRSVLECLFSPLCSDSLCFFQSIKRVHTCYPVWQKSLSHTSNGYLLVISFLSLLPFECATSLLMAICCRDFFTLANNDLKWWKHTQSCSPSCLNPSTLPIALCHVNLLRPFSSLILFHQLCKRWCSSSTHTHLMNTHTLQSLSLASGKISQSAQRQLTVSTICPLKLGICSADLALYHSSQGSAIFLLTHHTLKTSEVLNALRKGHDIRKWHSLWGNGLDVWPINKVSSISSISVLFAGLFLILKSFPSNFELRHCLNRVSAQLTDIAVPHCPSYCCSCDRRTLESPQTKPINPSLFPRPCSWWVIQGL